jgi:hypothetical protein
MIIKNILHVFKRRVWDFSDKKPSDKKGVYDFIVGKALRNIFSCVCHVTKKASLYISLFRCFFRQHGNATYILYIKQRKKESLFLQKGFPIVI